MRQRLRLVAGLATATVLACANGPAHAAVPVAAAVRAVGPASFLLTPSGLPNGYVPDDVLENADATARSIAYPGLIEDSAFAGFRSARAAVVQYVAQLRSRDDVSAFFANETAAVARTRSAARITLDKSFGDAGTIAYQDQGRRGEDWVTVEFAEGQYVAVLGTYNGESEQAAIVLLERLATSVDPRMRVTARALANPIGLSSKSGRTPRLSMLSLRTTTSNGRPKNLFSPRGSVYWAAAWRLSGVGTSTRETIAEQLRGSRGTLYANSLTDRAYDGDNVVADHVGLSGQPPGAYTIVVSITVGHRTVRSIQRFTVGTAHHT